MAHVEGQPDRDGLDKIVALGKVLCRTVLLFTPILMKKYPDNGTIILLLQAINGVCLLLPDVENEFLTPTGDNSDPLEDPTGTPGINPSLPPAEDPGIA